VPELVASAGPRATDAYIEFFIATIRNRNTRLAYARACYQFFHWARENGLALDTVRPFHVAAYIEQMPGSKPTIKQKLAAIRMLYDFLVVRQLVPVNPTASVRGPKYVVKRGKKKMLAPRRVAFGIAFDIARVCVHLRGDPTQHRCRDSFLRRPRLPRMAQKTELYLPSRLLLAL
jgi:hypothetical protein